MTGMHKLDSTEQPHTVGEALRKVADRLQQSNLAYGHGTANALDEAGYLVFGLLNLDHENPHQAHGRKLAEAENTLIDRALRRRIEDRIPVAYLINEAWFGGLQFFVDERVLVPRSPIAELIQDRFLPWLEADTVRDILDLGTGSGCIAIALALAFPAAHVDAVDLSAAALQVADINVERYALNERVNTLQSDFFQDIPTRTYDLIVSNPPYVDSQDMRDLAAEYWHEPRLGLEAGADGLDSVLMILHDAPDYLAAHGTIVVEVGNSQAALRREFPQVPFVWLEFANGGSGVFLLTATELAAHKNDFAAALAARDKHHVG